LWKPFWLGVVWKGFLEKGVLELSFDNMGRVVIDGSFQGQVDYRSRE
jgi:hypothetical protein